MRTRVLWICACGGMCAAVGVWIWTRAERLPRAPIDPNRELRVVKVNIGTNHVFATEAVWKRAVRRLLPRQWSGWLGRPKDVPFTTPHEALLVFVQEVDLATAQILPGNLDTAVAILPDGTGAMGVVSRRGRHSEARFSVFARGEARIPLRLTFGTSVVEISVENPNRVVQSKWSGRTLPQTNTVAGTEFVLHRLSRLGSDCVGMAYTRGTNGERTGWTSWRITAFDSWGNWAMGDGTHSLRLPGTLPRSEPIWKVRAIASEYISAAFVEMPTNREPLVIVPKSRLHSQGVQFLMWAAPGTYKISDRLEVTCASAASNRSNSPPPTLVAGSGLSWELACAEPGVLCVSDGIVRPSVRVRERIGNGGRIFGTTRPISANQRNKVAQFFAPRLPPVTTNLEIEVILRLPAADFFVNAPQARDPKSASAPRR